MAAAANFPPFSLPTSWTQSSQRESPFNPLFMTVFIELKAKTPEDMIFLSLSTNHDVLCLFLHNPTDSSKTEIDSFCTDQKATVAQKRKISSIFQTLYQTALQNSQLPEEMAQIQAALPSLQASDLSRQTKNALQRAKLFFDLSQEKISFLSTKEAANFRAGLSELLNLIGKILPLQKHLDPSHNQRLLDLAAIQNKHTFTEHYPHVVAKIQAVKAEICKISAFMPALLHRQTLLGRAIQIPQEPFQESPSFFVNYAASLYGAAGDVFWTLCQDSIDMRRFAEAQRIDPDTLDGNPDQEIINYLWDYCPALRDLTFDDWITKMIAAVPLLQLEQASTQLQTLLNDIALMANSDFEQVEQEAMIDSYKKQMQTICLGLLQEAVKVNPSLNPLLVNAS